MFSSTPFRESGVRILETHLSRLMHSATCYWSDNIECPRERRLSSAYNLRPDYMANFDSARAEFSPVGRAETSAQFLKEILLKWKRRLCGEGFSPGKRPEKSMKSLPVFQPWLNKWVDGNFSHCKICHVIFNPSREWVSSPQMNSSFFLFLKLSYDRYACVFLREVF